MDSNSPYLPPAAAPPPIPAPSGIEPPAVKVFGIIHLVMAGIGILTGLWYLALQWTGNPFLDSRAPGYEAQLAYQQELQWVTSMSGIFLLVLAGLLVTSGVKLIRSQPDGVMWSNRYAWTSIATKLVTLVVTVIFVLPATNRMMGEIIDATPGMRAGNDKMFASLMRVGTAIGAVATPVVSCLYPALALFFLSRPAVKEWRRRRGGA